VEGESKGVAMKEGRKNKGLAGTFLAIIMVVLAGCGSGNEANYDLGSAAGGTGLTNSFDSPVEMGVGDIMPIELSGSGAAEVDFSGVDTSERFILVLGNAKEGGSGVSMQLSTSISDTLEGEPNISVEANLTGDDEMQADEILSTWMRAIEVDFAMNAPQHHDVSVGKAMSLEKAVTMGSTRSFHMLNSLSSATSFTDATGRVQCVGQNIILYVDIKLYEVLSASEINDMFSPLCDDFDEDVEYEQELYGSLSDIDNNDKLIVFSTMAVNELGSLGGGIITGYFYAGDLYSREASNPVSNYGEIIYTMVPDPSGRWGVPVDDNFTLGNLIPAVLVHEAQHAISYSQKVFEQGGAPEEPWLNEAMSHLTEDIMGYGKEMPSRVSMFLDNTAAAGLITQFTPNLVERGASYMFLRYLYEQHDDPNSFLRELMNSDRIGVENVEHAFNGNAGFQTFSQFMARWSIALAMTGKGISSDPRYVYQQRERHELTNNWTGICLSCEAEDGRGTVLDGVQMVPYFGYHTVSLDSSALKFYELQTVPDDIMIETDPNANPFAVLIRTE
jgi:hypothetical protein